MSKGPPTTVSRLPLERLWRDGIYLDAVRSKYLNVDGVKEMLKVGPIQFVTAKGASPIQWIPLSNCYEFWKAEVQPHLADPDQKCYLDDFPSSYFYFASEWNCSGIDRLILLEMNH